MKRGLASPRGIFYIGRKRILLLVFLVAGSPANGQRLGIAVTPLSQQAPQLTERLIRRLEESQNVTAIAFKIEGSMDFNPGRLPRW